MSNAFRAYDIHNRLHEITDHCGIIKKVKGVDGAIYFDHKLSKEYLEYLKVQSAIKNSKTKK